MLREYPAGACGIPGILMPAACPTFMGLTFIFIGVNPPLDAIIQIHKWFKSVGNFYQIRPKNDFGKLLTARRRYESQSMTLTEYSYF